MNHDDSRELWRRLEAEYAVLHPKRTVHLDDGAGIWIGKVHDAMRDGLTFETAWAQVQREIQLIEGRYVPPPAPPVDAALRQRAGLSYYTSLTDPRVDVRAFATRLADAGATLTRVWLFDAWAVDQGGPGQYNGFTPFLQVSDGRWDLDAVRLTYLGRLRAYVEALNAQGVLPLLSGLELYTWHSSKQGLLWVPDQNALWMRHNVQGLRYDGDDAGFFVLGTGGPHAWLGAFYRRVVAALEGLAYAVETGNEMPEKALHYRLRDLWRAAGFTGWIATNRQEDTPGQYANMRVGADFDVISYHGKRDLGYLDEDFPREPRHRTFRDFYARGGADRRRVILSSDGCRKNTDPDDAYDYPTLGQVFRDVWARGCSIEHQSALKLRGFTQGRIDLNDLEVAWLRELVA